MAISSSNFKLDSRRGYLGPVGELVTGTLTGPTSYSGSGEVISNALCHTVMGKRELLYIAFSPPIASGATTTSSGGVISWEVQTKTSGSDQGKIHFFRSGAAALSANSSTEVAAGTNLSGYISRFMALIR